MADRGAQIEDAIRAAFEDAGLVSDWALVVEIAGSEEVALHHVTSDNATGWKAHGMALYLAAAHPPQPIYLRDEGDD